MLEFTNTIEKRKMKEQVLDKMDLERERGITIKMQPARMSYSKDKKDYILNLIDTPGHIDFSYEVSRALKAVEGSLLLVDSTQGVQAQTLTTLRMAQDMNLTIIPVLSKIDSPLAQIEEVKKEVAKLLSCAEDSIFETSGKTGEGIEELLNEIIERVEPPKSEQVGKGSRGLIFDFEYSNHKGVIVYTRIIDGSIQKGEKLLLRAAKKQFVVQEVGIFSPDAKSKSSLDAGEIGYVVTGLKEPGMASVGDTITDVTKPLPGLPGYQNPQPVVWASIFPESQDDFGPLSKALQRLHLSDSSLSYEEVSSGSLGRGFRCGFLGMLHLEIVSERLKREFDLDLIVTLPSVTYQVKWENGKTELIYSSLLFPDHGEQVEVEEPWAKVYIITPHSHTSPLLQIVHDFEAQVVHTENFGDARMKIDLEMPLRELMRGFFDEVKRVTSGYASLSYELSGLKKADVVKLEILIAEEPAPAFTRVVSRNRVEREAKDMVNRLHEHLPRQLFRTKIQARALGRIISSQSLPALKKDVTGHLYGGDITRKMKLREKQKKGKKRLLEQGKVSIPHEVFLKVLRGDSSSA